MNVVIRPDFDCIVIGGGLLGVASASAIARTGKRVALIERNSKLGAETSSRNSGVVHAGLYYPPGSLKAIACTEGRRLLYQRCERLGLGHMKVGKIVVATTPAELSQLEAMATRARENHAGEVRLLSQRETKELEPQVQALGSLLSPESGIVDVHDLLYSYKKEALDSGVDFTFETTVEGLERRGSTFRVNCCAEERQRFVVTASVVVNAAGLFASQLAQLAGVDTRASRLVYHFCKGDYFSLGPRHRGRVNRLVYPVPSHAGLGIHLTLDLSGQLMAGPDTEYVDELNYGVKDSKRALFAEALRRYYPDVADDELSPAYSGIRPKLQGPSDAFRDFVVDDLAEQGAPGMIALLGVESPGLTASEYLAERVAKLVARYI